jgi:hypothetical protein
MNNLQRSSRANFNVLSEGELTQVLGGRDHQRKRCGDHYEERRRKNDKNGKQRPPQIPFPILL